MSKKVAHLESYIIDGAKIMVGIFLFVAAAIYLCSATLSILFPYPLDYGEAALVDQAMHLSVGQNIYRDISTPPYTIANYPPLYVLLLAPFVKLLGPTFLAGRAISVLSALATAIFLSFIIYLDSKERLAAFVAGIFFLATPYVVYWSGLLRIDLLGLALSLAALYLLARWPTARWSWVAGSLLLVAAIYTRQSYALAAPLAAFVWLWTHERRRAAELALSVAGLSLALFLLLNIVTGGGFFFHTVTANINEFRLESLRQSLVDLGGTAPLLLSLGLVFLFRGRDKIRLWPLTAGYLVGALISTLTIGKIGSNVNYFLELAAALSLVAGVAVARSRPYPWRQAALLILLALQIGLLMQTTLEEFVDRRLIPRWRDQAALANLERMVAEADGPVLADEYLGLVTLQGRPLYLQPFAMTQLAWAGRWDQTKLIESIAHQTFPLILIYYLPFTNLHKERWTAEMLSAVERYYRPVQVQGGTVIYQPQPKSPVAPIPAPTRPDYFFPDNARLGPLRHISQVPYVFQPQIAVNPINSDQVAAIVGTTSYIDCNNFSACQLDLMLYTSTDGGAAWIQVRPFIKPNQFTFEGTVEFGPAGDLYVLGIRDGGIMLNRTGRDRDYNIRQATQQPVTRAQILLTRPWLRIEPGAGELFLSYAAQDRGTFASPSLNRSSDGGGQWSATARVVDQSIAIADLTAFQATPPADIQALFGSGNQVALVWVWSPEPWNWPRGIWISTSDDGGQSFAPSTQIGESWGLINTAFHKGNYYIIYRPGTEPRQVLALAVSQDGGLTWSSTVVSGDIPLAFDVDKAPGLEIAPDGTIDIVFYAHGQNPADCLLDVKSWRATVLEGWIDNCVYDVYYTFSRDGGRSFSQPMRLNETPVRGDRFVRLAGRSTAGSHIGMASTKSYAYPIWIDTQDSGRPQAFTTRIER